MSWGIAILMLGASLALAGRWMYSLITIPMMIIWILSVQLRWRWGATLIFAAYYIFAMTGILLDGPPTWLVVGAFAALIGWDLVDFLWRLEYTGRIESEDKIVTQHLVRLIIIALGGFLLALFALRFQIKLNFGWVLGLGFLVILMIRWGVDLARRWVG
jgi:hypothetical protein